MGVSVDVRGWTMWHGCGCAWMDGGGGGSGSGWMVNVGEWMASANPKPTPLGGGGEVGQPLMATCWVRKGQSERREKREGRRAGGRRGEGEDDTATAAGSDAQLGVGESCIQRF
eukprot:226898-Chlamydomonas_euryale.AAC.1